MQNSQHKTQQLTESTLLLLIQRVLKHKTDESQMVIWLSPLSFRVLIFELRKKKNYMLLAKMRFPPKFMY